jgi:hypothetical protein
VLRLCKAPHANVSRARHAAISELRRVVDHEPVPALRSELGIPALRRVDELAAQLEGAGALA